MARPLYATAQQYLAAFEGLRERGISANYWKFLRAHRDVGARPITWRRLGMTMGLPERTAFTTVNLQYGTFARLLGKELPPADLPSYRKGKKVVYFWLHLLAEHAEKDDRGEQEFVMRPEVVAALKRFDWPDASGGPEGKVVAPDGPAIDVGQPPQRIESTVSRIVRDTSIVRELKALHKNTCQRCGKRMKLGASRFYSEGHHLRPLGKPHNGPDVRSNIVILCADCHVLLDFLAVAVEPTGLRSNGAHVLDATYVLYHNDMVRSQLGA